MKPCVLTSLYIIIISSSSCRENYFNLRHKIKIKCLLLLPYTLLQTWQIATSSAVLKSSLFVQRVQSPLNDLTKSSKFGEKMCLACQEPITHGWIRQDTDSTLWVAVWPCDFVSFHGFPQEWTEAGIAVKLNVAPQHLPRVSASHRLSDIFQRAKKSS